MSAEIQRNSPLTDLKEGALNWIGSGFSFILKFFCLSCRGWILGVFYRNPKNIPCSKRITVCFLCRYLNIILCHGFCLCCAKAEDHKDEILKSVRDD